MRVFIHRLFFELLLVTSAIGFLFRRNLPDFEQTTTSKRPPAFYKLLKNSEDTIRWLGNKTAESLNGLFNLNNQTSNFPSTSSPAVDDKRPFLAWINRFHFKSSSMEYSEDSEEDDSGDSLVIAHRTLNQGFSWGPAPLQNVSHVAAKTVDNTTRPLDSVIAYVKDTALSLAFRSHAYIKQTISSVFPKKVPFVARQLSSEAIEKRLSNFWNKHQLLQNITYKIKKFSNIK